VVSLSPMGLSVKRLGAWLGAILRRTQTEHPETDWNTLTALGEAMTFPPMIAPDNDDGAQPDNLRAPDDPRRSES
jgi:hypothetical protein